MTDLAVAAHVWKLNFLFSTEVLTEAASEIEALGVEPKEFFLLDGVPERPYPAELARQLSMAKPSVTLHLKNLQAKGFITRGIDPNDLRRHSLALTELGRETLEKARRIIALKYGERLSRLTPGERKDFAAMLEKLTD